MGEVNDNLVAEAKDDQVVETRADQVVVANDVQVAVVNSDGLLEVVTFAIQDLKEMGEVNAGQIAQEIEVGVLIADRVPINQDIEDVNSINF